MPIVNIAIRSRDGTARDTALSLCQELGVTAARVMVLPESGSAEGFVDVLFNAAEADLAAIRVNVRGRLDVVAYSQQSCEDILAAEARGTSTTSVDYEDLLFPGSDFSPNRHP